MGRRNLWKMSAASLPTLASLVLLHRKTIPHGEVEVIAVVVVVVVVKTNITTIVSLRKERMITSSRIVTYRTSARATTSVDNPSRTRSPCTADTT